MQQQSPNRKYGRINQNASRHTASTASAPSGKIHHIQKKSEDGYLQIHAKHDPKAGKPLPPNPNKRHTDSITSTKSMPAYTNIRQKQNNTFQAPTMPNMNINTPPPPQMHRPQSNHMHPMQHRNMSVPHPNMPHVNRYNTVPPNYNQRNMSMPHAHPYHQPNPIYGGPNMNPYGHRSFSPPVSPHMNMQYANPAFRPTMQSYGTHTHNPSYGYIPEQRGVIELGQPVISDAWETGKKKESIVRPKDTFKEPLLHDDDDIDYELDDKTEKAAKKGCCVIL